MLDTILLVAAFILFLIAAVGFSPRGIQLGWIGLACWVATALT